MYEAFVSARLAAEAVLDVLAGRAETVEPYTERLAEALGPLAGASGARRSRSTAIPRTTFALARAPLVWPVVERLVRGDIKAPDEARGLARPPLKAIAALARLARARRRGLRQPVAGDAVDLVERGDAVEREADPALAERRHPLLDGGGEDLFGGRRRSAARILPSTDIAS